MPLARRVITQQVTSYDRRNDLCLQRDAIGNVRQEAAPLTNGNQVVTFMKPDGYALESVKGLS
jgi:hypothetical protein